MDDGSAERRIGEEEGTTERRRVAVKSRTDAVRKRGTRKVMALPAYTVIAAGRFESLFSSYKDIDS